MKPRRLLEPNGKFDRVLYAVMSLTLPHTTFLIWDKPDLQFATMVCAGWWVVATWYTIGWILESYRRWRALRRSR